MGREGKFQLSEVSREAMAECVQTLESKKLFGIESAENDLVHFYFPNNIECRR
jgi:hypothetical protein